MRARCLCAAAAAQEAPESGLRPTLQLMARTKLSCLAWHRTQRGLLACSDYEGLVTLWDTERGMRCTDFVEV